MRRLVVIALFVTACGPSTSPSVSVAPSAAQLTAATTAAATPPETPTATSAGTSGGSGHVVHVNLLVPLASAAALGSACDAAALRATGPKAAAIPGSRLMLYDPALAGRDVFQPAEPAETPADTNGTSATTEPSPTIQASAPIQTSAPITPLGEQPVPQTGTVVKPINDDPSFPAACRFSVDVPTTADPDKGYGFGVGSIYFPIPLMLRADVEAAGWVANIGVNPQ